MEDMQVIAEGSGADPAALASADALLKKGDEAEIRIFVENAPDPDALKALEMELISGGLVLRDNIAYDSGVIVVRYVKTAQPETTSIGLVWFIPVIIFGVLGIGGGIFGWQLAKGITSALTNPIFIIGVAGLLLFFLMRRRKQEAEA